MSQILICFLGRLPCPQRLQLAGWFVLAIEWPHLPQALALRRLARRICAPLRNVTMLEEPDIWHAKRDFSLIRRRAGGPCCSFWRLGRDNFFFKSPSSGLACSWIRDARRTPAGRSEWDPGPRVRVFRRFHVDISDRFIRFLQNAAYGVKTTRVPSGSGTQGPRWSTARTLLGHCCHGGSWMPGWTHWHLIHKLLALVDDGPDPATAWSGASSVQAHPRCRCAASCAAF